MDRKRITIGIIVLVISAVSIFLLDKKFGDDNEKHGVRVANQLKKVKNQTIELEERMAVISRNLDRSEEKIEDLRSKIKNYEEVNANTKNPKDLESYISNLKDYRSELIFYKDNLSTLRIMGPTYFEKINEYSVLSKDAMEEIYENPIKNTIIRKFKFSKTVFTKEDNEIHESPLMKSILATNEKLNYLKEHNTLLIVEDTSEDKLFTYKDISIDFNPLENLKKGDYIKFGNYNDEPILWRVIKQDDDGILIFADKIICFKPFDAYGDLTDDRGDIARKQFGSNYWGKSSIREWLNSDDYTVKYSHQAPDDSHVYEGLYDFADEPGFLTNFTAEEKALISPRKNRVVLNEWDKDVKDGGTEAFDYKYTLESFEKYWYKVFEDKVFLLSEYELHEYISIKIINTYRTKGSMNNAEHLKGTVYERGGYNYTGYFLRTPSPSSASMVNSIGSSFTHAYKANGIRPALYLKHSLKLSGAGTEIAPYSIDLDDKN